LISLAACQQNGDTRKVSGQLDTTQFPLMKGGAEVVGAAMSGRTHRAPIRSDGSFEIELLVGERYQLRFAQKTATDGVFDAFAVLTVDGNSRRTFQVMAGPAVDLGRVGLVGTIARSSSSLRAFTGGDDDDGDSTDDDDDTDSTDTSTDADSDSDDADSTDDDSDSSDADSDHDSDDVDQVCDEPGGMDMEDVEAENDPADDMCACSDDDDADGDSDSDSTDSDADTTDTDADSDSVDDPADTDNDSDSDSDSDSDTDSSGADTDDDDDDSDSCSSDHHDDDLDEPCEETPPTPPGGGGNDPGDTDGDGIPDNEDPDADGDGVPDGGGNIPCAANEDCPAGMVCTAGFCAGV
jgi:hypothetical protein